MTTSIERKYGIATAMNATRTTHQKISIASIGIEALPAPRSTAERQCEAASRKKKTEGRHGLHKAVIVTGQHLKILLKTRALFPDLQLIDLHGHVQGNGVGDHIERILEQVRDVHPEILHDILKPLRTVAEVLCGLQGQLVELLGA